MYSADVKLQIKIRNRRLQHYVTWLANDGTGYAAYYDVVVVVQAEYRYDVWCTNVLFVEDNSLDTEAANTFVLDIGKKAQMDHK